jgi:Tfp pilus assembly protein PilO
VSGRRSPIIAGVAAVLVCALAVFFLVLPKRAEVSDAQKQLDTVRNETAQLQAKLNALVDAKAQAPAARRTIRRVEQEIPSTADEPGLILLLRHAAERSGVDFTDLAVSVPTASSTASFSTIPVSITITGTYFSLDEFMFRIETLPRAAKVLAGTISAATSGTVGSTTNELTMQISMEMYTSDTSAGPGSVPGPTGA